MKKRNSGELAAGVVARTWTMVKAKLSFAKGTKKEVQEALQLTWVLKGVIKRAQLTFLYIGRMLTQVKEQGKPNVVTGNSWVY